MTEQHLKERWERIKTQTTAVGRFQTDVQELESRMMLESQAIAVGFRSDSISGLSPKSTS